MVMASSMSMVLALWHLWQAIRHVLSHNPVEFRLLVFRPFKGEIIAGRISSCTEQGIRGMSSSPSDIQDSRIANKYFYLVSVNFFSDIHIPASLLFEGSTL